MAGEVPAAELGWSAAAFADKASAVQVAYPCRKPGAFAGVVRVHFSVVGCGRQRCGFAGRHCNVWSYSTGAIMPTAFCTRRLWNGQVRTVSMSTGCDAAR